MVILCQVVSNCLILLLLQVVWTTNGIAPTGVTISEITCTSALVSWDEPADNRSITYTVQWRLTNKRGSRQMEGAETVIGQHHFMLRELLPSNTKFMRRYGVQVFSTTEQGVKMSNSEVFFRTKTYAIAVQPFATPSESEVVIEWSTPDVNTGCNGSQISQYIITYNPVGSADISEVTVESIEQTVIWRITNLMPFTMYQYAVTVVDPSGINITSATKYFTTQNDLPPPPTLLSPELHSNSITVTWKQPVNASTYEIWHYVVKVKQVTTSSTTILPYNNTGDKVQVETIEKLMPDTLYEILVASENSVGMGGFSEDHLLVVTTSFVPTAPGNLTAKADSNQTLIVSWIYPPSLIEQLTSFEVTYSLVSAYNTSVGMRTFAESDAFNTTETSFHFALISSVTNYIFTVTPYSATRAGDSARVLFNDFSGADSVEDPVIFFNLRLSDTSSNLSYSSQADIDKTNSDLTGLIQFSIEDICQCTLPSYTLRGSMDMCDSQTNCAIYTGRLLGSDTASATEVFKMVEDWLVTQNGSLLNEELNIDPDCPLRLSSPSDTVCTISDISTDDESSKNSEFIEVIKMLSIGVGSGFGVIICAVIICVCTCKLRKKLRRKEKLDAIYIESGTRHTPFLETQDTQRHYSIVIERNPSYHRHRKTAIKQFDKANDNQLEACSSNSLDSEYPYSYTSLKTAQRQVDALAKKQKEEGITHLTVEQPQRHVSEISNAYVVESLSSSGYYFNEDNDSTFHPPPTPNSQGPYLSVS